MHNLQAVRAMCQQCDFTQLEGVSDAALAHPARGVLREGYAWYAVRYNTARISYQSSSACPVLPCPVLSCPVLAWPHPRNGAKRCYFFLMADLLLYGKRSRPDDQVQVRRCIRLDRYTPRGVC